jgi:hypothetical protein
VASAARVYGEERMRTLFGPVDPVDRDRLRALEDGDRVDLGDRSLEALYTRATPPTTWRWPTP